MLQLLASSAPSRYSFLFLLPMTHPGIQGMLAHKTIGTVPAELGKGGGMEEGDVLFSAQVKDSESQRMPPFPKFLSSPKASSVA